MSMQVAFFRNMNLGQARSRSPRSSELLDAFAAAGATSALNFQTNGTVIFAGDEPAALAESVVTRLTAVTGYADLVVVRSAAWLIDAVGRIDPGLTAGEVALFDAPSLLELALPLIERVPTGELVVHTLTHSHAVTSTTGSGISAGPVLTRLIGVPVTCRGIPTMRRLVARLGILTAHAKQAPG
ncbi:DUF1697 domain-containing protein [Tessaracoccus sp. MC1627]|uniref:DUF1697 domain-containing protein n=1 Tax=Tessaracoccus sp. MC1627 TaxID=2760312 RepID=UPI0016015A30|nr:DUF1697 domain-containing protein [Tessaracoccus sp. MC1627]MBB1514049.1 DUF1697 domain-containing protein [Tessaracoccus sp. MC1627]